jgi:hypothetical protein
MAIPTGRPEDLEVIHAVMPSTNAMSATTAPRNGIQQKISEMIAMTSAVMASPEAPGRGA